MIERRLNIGRWVAEFYFGEYDMDTLLDRLFDFGAPYQVLRQAYDLMESGQMNTGFTFSNPEERLAIVAVGPTTGGEEFQDTLVHEVHHLAVAIASGLGVDLESETPAYIAGDSIRDLASVVCELGCKRCR